MDSNLKHFIGRICHDISSYISTMLMLEYKEGPLLQSIKGLRGFIETLRYVTYDAKLDKNRFKDSLKMLNTKANIQILNDINEDALPIVSLIFLYINAKAKNFTYIVQNSPNNIRLLIKSELIVQDMFNDLNNVLIKILNNYISSNNIKVHINNNILEICH